LFFALGGTAVAASNSLLPKNSVGSAQIINGSLQKKDLAGKAVKALRGNKGARGIPGAAGPQGPAGPQGGQGPAGQDLTFTTTLHAGQTLTGVYSAATAGTGGYLGTTLTFQPRLPAAIAFANIHYIPTAGPFTSNCPGAGQAAAGHLCIYEKWINTATFVQAVNPESASPNGSSVQGVGLVWNATTAGANTRGVWAVQPAAGAAASTSAAHRSAPVALGG
jgi:hypothetical protein